ncbi:beta-ketoacyl-ACP synthase II [Enterobacteriaceae endosymbiont of Neohaemonia nigricornis]|uniref:beta-ketoacyl-ACP synthase II n=1 Tax=Enterobacteriaceae endosymbiont of Neohaemonia nigricornis TaxID=2675792 RepID=UPI0014496219|nr:beta-ketoacyl-ACP synthase II [Enterobacteriaceae endosymbiont of Neohaemonia nigricornis]QJC30284.1 beta-ketoacyl-ACP synthase II [Enterobacteriaceae endosymbiont of Neohaemonia nigricornis]
MCKRRVVITGLGIITPLGLDIKSNWYNITNGNSGIRLINDFDTCQYKTKIGGIIKNFTYVNNFTNKKRYIDFFIQYGLIACEQAMLDSGLVSFYKNNNTNRFGVAMGSGLGGIQTIEKNCIKLYNFGPKKIHPCFIPASINNMLTGYIALDFKLMGPSISLSTGCASGIHNIGLAYKMISYNDADIMIAGAAEKSITPLIIGGFNAIKALSTRNNEPKQASRPWDKDRDGFVLSDGAGVLILEEYYHAKKRNANIYAEIIGFGINNDAYHITAPSKDNKGAKLSMYNALIDARINIEQINYINAHGTSTKLGDLAEVCAIKSVFKHCCSKLAISSTKSMTGHLLGAAGAIESIYSILALKYQIIPPTINLYNPDENCNLDFIPNIARDTHNMKYVLCNSFGFGGINTSLIFKKI